MTVLDTSYSVVSAADAPPLLDAPPPPPLQPPEPAAGALRPGSSGGNVTSPISPEQPSPSGFSETAHLTAPTDGGRLAHATSSIVSVGASNPTFDDDMGLETDGLRVVTSTWRRRTLVIGTCLSVWLTAGLSSGFSPLKAMLIDEGIFSSLCPPASASSLAVAAVARLLKRSGGGGADSSIHGLCNDQILRLDLMYTLSQALGSFMVVPVGFILDRLGPKLLYLISCALMALGFLLFGIALMVGGDFESVILFAFIIISSAGGALYTASFHVANVFPLHSGLITLALNIAFDLSALIFTLVQFGYNALPSAADKHNLLRTFHFAYLVLFAAVFLFAAWLMPRRSVTSTGVLLESLHAAPVHGSRPVLGFGNDGPAHPDADDDGGGEYRASQDSFTQIDVKPGKDPKALAIAAPVAEIQATAVLDTPTTPAPAPVSPLLGRRTSRPPSASTPASQPRPPSALAHNRPPSASAYSRPVSAVGFEPRPPSSRTRPRSVQRRAVITIGGSSSGSTPRRPASADGRGGSGAAADGLPETSGVTVIRTPSLVRSGAGRPASATAGGGSSVSASLTPGAQQQTQGISPSSSSATPQPQQQANLATVSEEEHTTESDDDFEGLIRALSSAAPETSVPEPTGSPPPIDETVVTGLVSLMGPSRVGGTRPMALPGGTDEFPNPSPSLIRRGMPRRLESLSEAANSNASLGPPRAVAAPQSTHVVDTAGIGGALSLASSSDASAIISTASSDSSPPSRAADPPSAPVAAPAAAPAQPSPGALAPPSPRGSGFSARRSWSNLRVQIIRDKVLHRGTFAPVGTGRTAGMTQGPHPLRMPVQFSANTSQSTLPTTDGSSGDVAASMSGTRIPLAPGQEDGGDHRHPVDEHDGEDDGYPMTPMSAIEYSTNQPVDPPPRRTVSSASGTRRSELRSAGGRAALRSAGMRDNLRSAGAREALRSAGAGGRSGTRGGGHGHAHAHSYTHSSHRPSTPTGPGAGYGGMGRRGTGTVAEIISSAVRQSPATFSGYVPASVVQEFVTAPMTRRGSWGSMVLSVLDLRSDAEAAAMSPTATQLPPPSHHPSAEVLFAAATSRGDATARRPSTMSTYSRRESTVSVLAAQASMGSDAHRHSVSVSRRGSRSRPADEPASGAPTPASSVSAEMKKTTSPEHLPEASTSRPGSGQSQVAVQASSTPPQQRPWTRQSTKFTRNVVNLEIFEAVPAPHPASGSQADALAGAEWSDLGDAADALDGESVNWTDTANMCLCLEHYSIAQQYKSPFYYLFVVHTVATALLLNFYMGSVNNQIQFLSADVYGPGPAATTAYTYMLAVWGVVLPVCSVVVAPFLGPLVMLTGYHTMFITVSVVSIAAGVLTMVPHLELQYVTMFLMSVLRPALWTVACNYIGKVFGFGSFGRLYGALLLLVGVANFVAYGLNTMSLGASSFLVANGIVLVLQFAALAFPILLYRWQRSFKARIVTIDASEADALVEAGDYF
ncbi:hypothetical protein H9P43_002849 [Blastocladiella emersonii ATCC 22665]|nr:hypothetical protein H9P43_002849 [Blastocladiella emersonii ATCC 22665]